MPMTDDRTPRGPGSGPNDFENTNPLLAGRFGEVVSHLAESLPRRAAAISAQSVRIARELETRAAPPRRVAVRWRLT
jgi:hypothetical protein